MSETIQVLYTCDSCIIKDRAVAIVVRAAEEEIYDFVQRIEVALSEDHKEVSPDCHITALTQIKIPMPINGGRLGSG